MKITAVSSVYETPPWGITEQPSFYNCCVAARTDQSPPALLATLKQIETNLGRVPTYRWGPRLIDIDLLLYDDVTHADATLTLPHPRMAERAFVLTPLAEIAADVVHPRTGQTIAAMAAAVSDEGLVKTAVSLSAAAGL